MGELLLQLAQRLILTVFDFQHEAVSFLLERRVVREHRHDRANTLNGASQRLTKLPRFSGREVQDARAIRVLEVVYAGDIVKPIGIRGVLFNDVAYGGPLAGAAHPGDKDVVAFAPHLQGHAECPLRPRLTDYVEAAPAVIYGLNFVRGDRERDMFRG